MAGITQVLGAGGTADEAAPVAGPLIGLRVAASRSLWRLGPAWAVLAGAVASGAPLLPGDGLLRLVGAVLLADAVWGAVWVPVAGDRPRPAGLTRPVSWPLPYMQPGGPAARLRSMLPDARWHDVLVAALLTGGLAALLGWPALLISLGALAVSLWALFVAQWGHEPALPRALLNVGLPWLLGLALSYRSIPLFAADGLPIAVWPVGGLALGAAFTLLDWGSQRACWSCASRARGIWLGQAAIILVLVALRLPWTTGLVAALLLPAAWFSQRAIDPGPGETSWRAAMLARSGPWWWAAMMVAALALR